MKLDPKYLIINKPQLLQNKYRIANIITFIFFWTVFAYLLRPIIVIFGWVFMGYFAHLTLEYTHSLKEILLGNLAIATYIMIAVFPMWAMYNKLRFSGKRDKRKNAAHLRVNNEILEDQNVPIQYKQPLHDTKNMDVYFDSYANITGFDLDGKNIKIPNQDKN